jgi:hypothetical protein
MLFITRFRTDTETWRIIAVGSFDILCSTQIQGSKAFEEFFISF